MTPNKPSLEKTIQIMEDVDRQRAEQHAISDDAQLAQEVEAAYKEQGLEVSQEMIAQAITRRTQKLYQIAPPTRFQSALGWVYLRRQMLAIGLTATGLVSVGAIVTTNAIEQSRYANEMSAMTVADQARADWQSWIAAQQASWAKPAQAGSVRAAVQPAINNQLLDMSTLAITLADPPPAKSVEFADAAARANWKTMLSRSSLILDDLSAKRAQVEVLMNQAVTSEGFDRWLAQTSAPTEDWAAAEWSKSLAQRSAGLSSQQWDMVRSAEERARLIDRAARSVRASSQVVKEWPAAVAARGQALLQTERTAWLSGSATAGAAAAAVVQNQNAYLMSEFTLTVVNKSGVRSGVERTPNDNPSAKNYYIVVNAVGPSGQELTLPITNEETQKTSDVDTFAVRVPKTVYEQIKEDKLDNGLVDRMAVIGRKPAGSFDISYNVATAGGMITEW